MNNPTWGLGAYQRAPAFSEKVNNEDTPMMTTRRTMALLGPVLGLIAALGLAPSATWAQGPTPFLAAGAANDIQGTVDAFRDALGEFNPPEPVSLPDGFRSIDWDAAPDGVSAPNPFPGDFFNADFAPRARGIEFATLGNGFQLSATAASGVGAEFANLRPELPGLLTTFSPERLFTPLGFTVTEVRFYVPGTQIYAVTDGFGAVFVDVDDAINARLDFFDADDNLIFSLNPPGAVTRDEGLSFAGAVFDQPVVARVVITSGTAPLDGPFEENLGAGVDLVALDDFIFGEPQAIVDAVEVTAAGANPQDIAQAVDEYRALLGDFNPPEPVGLADGFRSIDWDAAPDGVSAPNLFPGDFFNADFAPRARGIEFTSPGAFQLSATAASGVGVEFDNLLLGLSDLFQTFSPERLFTPLDSTTTEVRFFVPGTRTAALTDGFGAVFSDVDLAGAARLDYFDREGRLIYSLEVPVAPVDDEGLSFAGIAFGEAIVAKVIITSGTVPVGSPGAENPTAGIDQVVMDDFIFGEPQSLVGTTVISATGANADEIANAVQAYRDLLGTANPFEPVALPDGFRSINWDAAPDSVSAPNPFPGDFFNADFAPRARGIEFTTRGQGFQLSATQASGEGIEFDNLFPGLSTELSVFSPERLFTSLDSTLTNVYFFVPGTRQLALSEGFGAVFSDVDLEGSSRLEYYDIEGKLLLTQDVPPGPTPQESLSFVGVVFEQPLVARVVIRSGNAALNGVGFDDPALGIDQVAVDDLIFGEPQNSGLGGADEDLDGDDIPNRVELEEERDPAQKDNDVFEDDRLFVMQTYRDFLTREGDPEGVEFWTDVLGRLGEQGRIDMVTFFLDSEEFITQVETRFPGLTLAEATVTALYLGMLVRDPDQGGLEFWVDNFEQGVPRQELILLFIASVEYYNRFLPPRVPDAENPR